MCLVNSVIWVKKEPNSNGDKLYDDFSLDQRLKLENGELKDTSQILSSTNMQFYNGPMIGRNTEIFKILMQL